MLTRCWQRAIRTLFSQFDGFPDNSAQLEKALFDLVGD